MSQIALNSLWVLVAAFLVFFMNAGFALVESGLCRSKNTVNILAKNFIVFGLAVVGYWSIGYALMFGGDHAYAGSQGFFLTSLPTLMSGLPTQLHFFFQLCFAVTAATIVSGAVAERIKIQSFMCFAVILTAGVYPLVGHWGWGDGGWLLERGFTDFAGSTVVHSVGGWAALTGAIILGPRRGKFDKHGKPRPMPGHNMALVTLGGLFLWFGWFGFNGGSALGMGPGVPHIIVATAIAGALGTLAATAWTWFRHSKPDLTFIVNGMLGGLVGVTAGCNNVPVWAAAVIGIVCGVVVIESVLFFERRGIDDPVGAVSVHLVCGALGTLMVGLFANGSLPHLLGTNESGAVVTRGVDGLFFGGGVSLLADQAVGVLAVGVFVSMVSVASWLFIRSIFGLRVDPEDEYVGLDISEHGMEAYPAAREMAGAA